MKILKNLFVKTGYDTCISNLVACWLSFLTEKKVRPKADRVK